MVYYNFHEDFNEASIDKFVIWLNLQAQRDVTIFLQSGGGQCTCAEQLEYLFNKEKDRFTLVATDYIGSAAFRLFFQTKCNKFIIPGTTGMYHLAYAKLATNNNHHIPPNMPWHSMSKQSLTDELPAIKKFIKTMPFKIQEVNKILKGEEVYFSSGRMEELFKTKK